MRLLDRIVQTRATLRIASGATVVALPGPASFATALAACPLRLVLADPLTRLCASLAYADGDRLGGCLDLVHVPAERLWVEWLDAARAEYVAAAFGPNGEAPSGAAARAGAYLSTDRRGRRGTVRTFWGPADGDGEASLAPLVTEFDLDEDDAPAEPAEALFDGGATALASDDPALAGIFRHLRFRFDPAWAAFYRGTCRDAAERTTVLRQSLASVGSDLPVLFALFLLMSSRLQLPQRSSDLRRLNRRRGLAGHPPLLDHVEVCAPVVSAYAPAATGEADARRGPRMHHVRGHLVRRGSQVFWRVPHLRGRPAFGYLRARSVLLQFDARASLPRDGRIAEGLPTAFQAGQASPSPGG